jgi:hypothetical protein
MTETDPTAREAEEMLQRFVASLEGLGVKGLRDRYATPDRRGRPRGGATVTCEQVGPSGRLYQFETWVSLEGDDVRVFVSMFPERKVRLVHDIDFIVRP